MRIVRSACVSQVDLFDSPRPLVGVTIGNFDGCHLGHKGLISVLEKETARIATAEGKKPLKAILTFLPHPRIALRSGEAPLSRVNLNEYPELWPLFPFRERAEQIANRRIDLLFVAQFNKSFAALSPEQFVSDYLLNTLHARVVVVGHDWRFGKGREGTVDLLREYGNHFGFDVHVVSPVVLDGERVSSTTIKSFLVAGDVVSAAKQLGRLYQLQGRVVHGAGRGRTIGVPTANLHLGRRVLPLDGVYVSLVEVDGECLPAVTNIGTQPTFSGGKRRVETHILDREINLYGRRISVQLVDRIRGEQQFADAEQLLKQIAADISKARDVLRIK